MLEASDDGVHYRVVAELPEIVVPAAKAVPVRTVAFPPVTARRFRLVLSGASAADALPRLAAGVQLPPVLRRVSEFLVSEFALSAGGRVHQAEVKAGFAAAPDYDALDTEPGRGTAAIDPAQVLDVSGHVDEQGVLRWDAPAGDWLVLRFGASLTGQTNGPAPPEATGLEVDKLDGAKVRRYLDTYLGAASTAYGSTPCSATASSRDRRTSPTSCTNGSPSCGATTRCGGCPRSPATSSATRPAPTGSCGTTGACWPTCSPREYYGTLDEVAHARGPRRTTPRRWRTTARSSVTTSRCAATPTCRWARCGCSTPATAPKPTYVADLKGASSVAHVYGKPFTGAESMTAFHRPWSYTPRRLKHVADLELALGVTRFCIHTSPHQPTQVPPPGHRAVAAPRPDVHPVRAVGGAGRAVDRLPRPLLVPAEPGRAGGRRRGVHR